MAKLAALLKTTSMGLPDMAELVRRGGRNGDTILAHINPREAALLRKNGGSGKNNPNTGLPEFQDEEYSSYSPSDAGTDAEWAQAEPVTQVEQNIPAPTAPSEAPSYLDTGTAPTGAGEGFQAAPATSGYGLTQPTPDTGFRTGGGETGLALPPGYAPPSAQAPEITPITAPTPATPAAPRAEGGGLAKALGTDTMGLARLGLTGLGAVQGMGASQQAQQQAAANEAEIRRMAEPYRFQGQELMALGQAGRLTPAQQQRVDAMRAQQAQQLATMGQAGGGTASQQAEANIQRMSQQFAQQNIDEGMKLIGVADQYVQNAIKAGYQGSVDAQNASARFYQALAAGLGGAPGQERVTGTQK